MKACYACIHLMNPHQTADGKRRCRVTSNNLEVNAAVEADCEEFVRDPGSDDEVPPWYWGAWHVGGEGRGD